MNFSKRLVLRKSNLKLQIYKHVIAKTKNHKFSCRVSNENVSLCLETLSGNLPVPRNPPNSSLNLPNRHKKDMWPKKAKWPFFKNKKRPKELKNGQKITNLASKKLNWQPCIWASVFTSQLYTSLSAIV